jgi:ribonuclease Z
VAKLVVTFLGTSSATPTPSRNLPSIALQREGELILLDCGEGVQREVLKQGIGLGRDTTILITHLHGDHVTGLLGLLQTMSLAQRTKPVTIIAPEALRSWLRATTKYLHLGVTFEVFFVPTKTGVVQRTKAYRIRAARAVHSVEAFCYRVDENPRPGVFDPAKARDLGIPEGRRWGRLQRGRAVSVAGRRIRPEQVLGPPRQGRSLGYSGDTRPSKRLARFFEGVDLLIFDSTFTREDKKKAVERRHSTSEEAAQLAKAAGAKMLALTHFSARYRNSTGLLRNAKEVFPKTIAARDGLRLEIDYPEPG